jgi:hypothetical protein
VNLFYLNVGSTPTTDEGVKTIVAGFRKLAQLVLDSTKVTDVAVKELSSLKTLTYLSLNQTAVTNTGGKTLKEMQQLEFLYVFGTRMSGGMIQELHQALPYCFVYP